MAKPASRILVINDEPLELREFVKGLNAAARSLDNPLGISFTGVTTAQDALAAIERDGDLQAVLVDDTLYTLKNGARPKAQMSALELVEHGLLRIHGRACVRRGPVGVSADARLVDGAQSRHRRGAGQGGEGLRREAHVLRDQRHLDREQSHLPDADRARGEADPRSQ